MSDEVSAERAEEIAANAQTGLDEDIDTDQWSNTTVRDLARTVLTLRERHAAEVAQARREGAEAMRDGILDVLRAEERSADDLADEHGDEDAQMLLDVLRAIIGHVRALPLPGAEVR